MFDLEPDPPRSLPLDLPDPLTDPTLGFATAYGTSASASGVAIKEHSSVAGDRDEGREKPRARISERDLLWVESVSERLLGQSAPRAWERTFFDQAEGARPAESLHTDTPHTDTPRDVVREVREPAPSADEAVPASPESPKSPEPEPARAEAGQGLAPAADWEETPGADGGNTEGSAEGNVDNNIDASVAAPAQAEPDRPVHPTADDRPPPAEAPPVPAPPAHSAPVPPTPVHPSAAHPASAPVEAPPFSEADADWRHEDVRTADDQVIDLRDGARGPAYAPGDAGDRTPGADPQTVADDDPGTGSIDDEILRRALNSGDVALASAALELLDARARDRERITALETALRALLDQLDHDDLSPARLAITAHLLRRVLEA